MESPTCDDKSRIIGRSTTAAAESACSSLAECTRNLWFKFCRRKNIDHTTWGETKLAKCLSVVDLVFLGIGCTLGAGIYVLIGQVARSVAGPSIFLCFLVAGLASVFAGLCYAEFGARVPRAGSAYVYSYVTVGELWAFIIGWNLILEYVIGAASIARGTSAYIDSLAGKAMSTYLTEHVPIKAAYMSPYPDFLAFGLVLILSVLVCFGMSESALVNNIFTVINLFIIAYVIICGLFQVDSYNWSIPADKVPNPAENGDGGFFPFGVKGMLSGAATCFYAFVGFDIIATTGEETINPQKSIPIAIIGCLTVCSVCYMVPSIILTLMVPYYYLDPDAALSQAFAYHGWYVAEYIISAGAIISLVTCLLTSVCAMPRIVYAMASDGLIFTVLAKVNQRFKTPAVATIVSALLTGFMAMMFELRDLVDMMSIGTLLAYTLVATCVLLLRYEFDSCVVDVTSVDVETKIPSEKNYTVGRFCSDVFNPTATQPTQKTSLIFRCCLITHVAGALWAGLVLLELWNELAVAAWWAILLLCIPIAMMVMSIGIVWRQPQQSVSLSFKVPLVPLVPMFSVFINIYLMLNLSSSTWVRFLIWMIIGFLIYFIYGLHHDGEHIRSRNDYVELDGETLSQYTVTGAAGSMDDVRPLTSENTLPTKSSADMTDLELARNADLPAAYGVLTISAVPPEVASDAMSPAGDEASSSSHLPGINGTLQPPSSEELPVVSAVDKKTS